MGVAAVWSVFDALVHGAVDQVEPPRIAGNVSVLAAAALVFVADRFGGRVGLAAAASGLATGLVFGFNLAWVLTEGELPIPAAVFIGVSLALTTWAAYRFLVEAGQLSDRGTARLPWVWTVLTAVLVLASAGVSFAGAFTESAIQQLHTDELVAGSSGYEPGGTR